jgi:hypothetical protein
MANPICAMLLAQAIRRAASLAAWTAGKSSPTRIPMIAMTTSNSTKVKARLVLRIDLDMAVSPKRKWFVSRLQ